MPCLQLLFTPIYTTLKAIRLRDDPLYLSYGIFNAKLQSKDSCFAFDHRCTFEILDSETQIHKFVRIRRILKNSVIIRL